MSQDSIEKSIELKAPVARVWRALTDYREFGAWFRVSVREPFSVGGTSRGNMLFPGFEHLQWEATVKAMDAQDYFAFTWHPYAVEQRDYSHETPTLVEFRLEATAKGTLLTVRESGFDKLPPERRAEAFRMNEGGWATQMKNIQSYVE